MTGLNARRWLLENAAGDNHPIEVRIQAAQGLALMDIAAALWSIREELKGR